MKTAINIIKIPFIFHHTILLSSHSFERRIDQFLFSNIIFVKKSPDQEYDQDKDKDQV